jgi:hypothetical protein
MGNAGARPGDHRPGRAQSFFRTPEMEIVSLKNEKKTLEFKGFHGFTIA